MNHVREIRTALGINLRQFADRIGIDARSLSAIELGRVGMPHPERAAIIAEGLGVSVEDAFPDGPTIQRRPEPGHYCMETIRIKTNRKCNICHKPITRIPADSDPKHVRFCLDCRGRVDDLKGAGEWIGRGDEHGAETGPYVIR